MLEPLAARGELPVLGRLMAEGARGTLRSVVPPITPAAWASFATGKRPGKHGVYDFHVYDPRGYGDTFVTSRSLREPTIWHLLTAAGRRVGVVNLPVMYPPDPAAGTVVSGFDTPSLAAEFTAPADLRRRILERIPDYLLTAVADPTDPNLERDEAFEDFARQVERSCEQRTRIAQDLLADGAWDVFMCHYQDTDILQHRAWRFLVEPERHPAQAARLARVYRRLDTLIGDLLAAAPAGALVLVVSDHGFGAQTGRVHPNTLLHRWGYLAWRGRRRDRLRRSVRKRLVRFGIGREGTRPVPDSWISDARKQSFARSLPVHWHRTRAYVALAEIHGLLYLNLRGREPGGTVAPGEEARALAAELRERLLAVRDPRGDGPVFADVLPGDEVYPDDPHGRRPDLVLVPRPDLTVSRDLNHRRWIDHYPVVSGTHRPEGLLIAGGSGVRPGPLDRDVELVDLAPTILAAAGVAVPEDVDGRVLSELFVEPPAVAWTAPAARTSGPDAGLSAAEEAQVTERLRALGYMA